MQTLKQRLLLFLLLMLPITGAFAEPNNLGLHKLELERYFNGGRYYTDITTRIRNAKYYMSFRITQNHRLKHPKKLAMVLDIDETSLSNYEDIKRLQFGGTPAEIEAATADGHDAAIQSTLSLYDFAIAHSVAVFFVSGRKQFERDHTIKNLHDAGYHHWDGLLLKPNHYHKASAIPFKVSSRQKIIEMGYDIILNIGDQYSDLKGGYADMTIKLPNPFYYLD